MFPELGPEYGGSALVFHKYLVSRPEKFFSESAFDIFLNALRDIDERHAQGLIEYVEENATYINNAFRNAQEINAFEWHDQEVKAENDYLLLMLIDREVHPAYLRLVESVFQPMLRILAHFSRIADAKGTQGLNLYNIIHELPDEPYGDVKAPYVHLMRNGIAHGGVRYSENEIIYWDKKDNELALKPSNVVQKFDDMLDICNGLLLAFSVFSLSRSGMKNLVPQILMIEELRAETEAPYWDITGVLSSTAIGNKKQLIVYCNVRTMDESMVRFSTFQTAVLAERVAPSYDRYFVSMKARNGLPGWAIFGGSELANHRLSDHDIEEYSDVIQDYLPIFLANRKSLGILNRLERLKYAVQVSWPIILAEYQERIGLPQILSVVQASTVIRGEQS